MSGSHRPFVDSDTVFIEDSRSCYVPVRITGSSVPEDLTKFSKSSNELKYHCLLLRPTVTFVMDLRNPEIRE